MCSPLFHYKGVNSGFRCSRGHTSVLILAGTLANSGLEANVVRFSTASMSGAVATRHLFLFSSEKSPSRAFENGTEPVKISGSAFKKLREH